MKIGYFRVTQTEAKRPYHARLKEQGASLFFHEMKQSSDSSWKDRPQLAEALDMGGRNDTLLLYRLADISHQPEEWLTFLDDLLERELELEVMDYPTLRLADWCHLMTWMQEIPQHVKGEIKIIGIQPENEADRQLYRGLSPDREGRRLYWQVFSELVANRSIRRTARHYGLSRGTVYRINQQVKQAKHLLWLVGTFLMTMLGLQIARQYTDSLWLQGLIGLIATSLLIYFTYSDMRDDT